MAEKQPAFTVTDRRKFTAEGDLREGVESAAETVTPQPQPPPPAAPAGMFSANIADAVHPAPGVPTAAPERPGMFSANIADAVHPAPGVPTAAPERPGMFSANVADAVHPAPGVPISAPERPVVGQFSAHVAEAAQPAPAAPNLNARVIEMPSPAAPPPATAAASVPELAASAPPEDLLETIEDAGEDADLPDPTAAESAEQHAVYRQTAKQLDEMIRQANPGVKMAGEVTIDHVIQSIYLSAVVAMGAAAEPGQKPRIDIIGARQSIDMLTVLQEKTQGNLNEKEQRLLQNMLFELRMMFLEITQAIGQQSRIVPPGKR